MMKLKPCPFCGGEMEFHREPEGNYFIQYWMHAEQSGCVLDQMFMPFTIGAGDARPEDGYVGEYGEAWNRRVDNG